jgi:hypothetical protein
MKSRKQRAGAPSSCRPLSITNCQENPDCYVNKSGKCTKKSVRGAKPIVHKEKPPKVYAEQPCKLITENCSAIPKCLLNKKGKCQQRPQRKGAVVAPQQLSIVRRAEEAKQQALIARRAEEERKLFEDVIRRLKEEIRLEEEAKQQALIARKASSIRVGSKEVDPISLVFHLDFEAILRDTQNFGNLSNYSREVKSIGTNSANGFIRKYKYNSEHYEVDVVQKNNLNYMGDSLVYEYLVGQCVNHFASFYPCFSKTYQICKYNTPADYKQILYLKDPVLPTGLDKMLTVLNTDDIAELIKTGCANNQHICIMTQYLPFDIDLGKYLDDPSRETSTLITILYLLHACLASFSNQFTHYDLHYENVQLVKIPNNKYSIFRMHLPNGRVISFKTNYIPCIIDYGRCYVNCAALNSTDIYRTVCEYDSNNPDPKQRVCGESCGNSTGYEVGPKYDRNTKEFIPATYENDYIDPTRRNISHDLRNLNYINKRYEFTKNTYSDRSLNELLQSLTPSYSNFGQEEETEMEPNIINNVLSANRAFIKIIDNPRFVAENNAQFRSSSYYNTVDIWTDLSRPFEVSIDSSM